MGPAGEVQSKEADEFRKLPSHGWTAGETHLCGLWIMRKTHESTFKMDGN